MLKCCFNWRVVAGLGLVAVGVALFQPSLLARAGPLLVYAICPLSMLVMMLTMMRMQARGLPAARSGNASTQQEAMVTVPASLFAKLSEGQPQPPSLPHASSPALTTETIEGEVVPSSRIGDDGAEKNA